LGTEYGFTRVVKGVSFEEARRRIEAALMPLSEARNPRKDAPFALLFALGLCTLLYTLIHLVVLGVLAWRVGMTFGALLAVMFAGINLSSLSRVKAVELGDRLSAAHRALLEHRPAEAEQEAAAVLAKRPSGATLQWASELLGWARLWQGDLAGADRAVARYAHAGGPSGCFRGAQALAAGRVGEGVAVLAWAFANEAPGPSKSLGAVAAAGSGQAEAVARELLLLDGGAGIEPARLLQGLLAYAGYHDAAASVGRLLPAGA
jgi:hypothetical protein